MHQPAINDLSLSVAQQVESLKAVLNSYAKGENIVPEGKKECDELIQLLADFECWDVYVPVVKSLIARSKGNSAKLYYQNLAKVYFNYLDQPEEVCKLFLDAVSALDWSFSLFWRYMIFEAMYHKNYATEAFVIEYLVKHYDSIQSRGDFLEKAFERLILIYEEKLHIEDKILSLYRSLREVNNKNHKALMYFKNVYMQSQQWGEVETCLKLLVESSLGAGEEAFYRIELATVYLHYLDETEEALEVLGGVDPSSGFGACQVKFSLLMMVGEFELALEALQPLKQLANSSEQKATIYYHAAVCQLNIGSKDMAMKYLENSLKRFFHVYVLKQYINLALGNRNKKALIIALKLIEKQKIDQSLIEKSKAIRMQYLPEPTYKSLTSLA